MTADLRGLTRIKVKGKIKSKDGQEIWPFVMSARYEPLVEVWTGKVKGLGIFDRGFSRINAD